MEQQIIQEEVRISLLVSQSDESVFVKSLPVRAFLFESEMMVGQKNINFGKIVVGEVSNRGVALSNKSDFPLLYNISKSGSISSGFLKVLNGRRGVIAAMSSKVVEFEFRPKLPGQFEEALTIYNALNSKDAQVVIIKATINKTDLFHLLPDDSPGSVTEYTQDEHLSQLESEIMNSVCDMQRAYMRDKGVEHVPQLVPLPVFYLGHVLPSTPSSRSFMFRLQNPSTKQRQLVLAVQDIAYSNSNEGSSSIQCSYTVVFRDNGNHESSSGLSAEDRKRLLDKLEGYNQKLKIAVRKGKPEKEQKYLAKIAEVKSKLDIEPPIVPNESSEALDVLGSTSEAIRQGDTHFTLNPREIITVRVDVDILIVASGGDLACCMTALRVYEGRNEDDVKYIFFGTGCVTGLEGIQVDNDLAPASVPALMVDTEASVITSESTQSVMSPTTPPGDVVISHSSEVLVDVSCIGAKKHVSFGDVALDTTEGQMTTVTIINTSLSEELAYYTLVNASSLSACGQVEVIENQRGTVSVGDMVIISLKFVPLKIGKFECSLLVVNASRESDFVNIMLTANVSYRQSHFVLFPELVCDDMGKHNKLDLGLLQTAISEQFVEFIFPLKIVNVYSEVIFVTAISNLRKQCFVYYDEECSVRATMCELKPFETSVLYIMLRPSNLSSDDAVNGREFRGGIRLMFFQNPHSRKRVTAEDVTDDVSLTPDKKLFESSIVFGAVIGRSRLRMNIVPPRFRVLSIVQQSTSSMIKGTLEVENLSPVFPAAYTITSGNDDRTEMCPLDHTEKNSFSFNITKGQNDTISSGQHSLVEYSITFSNLSGLAVIPLTLTNLSTHETQKLNLSYFFDSAVVHAYVPQLESPEEERISRRRIASCGLESNVLYARNVFVSRYPDMNFLFPLWAVPAEVTPADEAKSNTVPDSDKTSDMLITCGADKILFQWELCNPRNVTVRLSPISNIPVKVLCEVVNDEPLSSTARSRSPVTIGGGSALRRPKARSFAGLEQQRTMVSIPAELTAQGFTICGDPISILPYQSVLVCAQSESGRSIAGEVNSVNAIFRSGVVAFVSAAQTLESFFNPNPVKQTLRNIPSIDCGTVHPLLSYLPVNYRLVIPTLRVVTPRINLGVVRRYNSSSFFVEVENATDDSIPFRVENVPDWMYLLSTTEGCVVIPSGRRRGSRSSAMMTRTLHAGARKVTRLEFGLHFPRYMTSSTISHTLRLKNLAAFTPQAPNRRDFVNIEMTCEYDATMALVVKDGRGLRHSIREKTNNQFVNIDKVGVPRGVDCAPTMSNFSIHNTTTAHLRVTPSVSTSPMFAQLIDISLLSDGTEDALMDEFEIPPGASYDCALVITPVPCSHISPQVQEEIELASPPSDVDEGGSSGEEERDSEHVTALGPVNGVLDSVMFGEIYLNYSIIDQPEDMSLDRSSHDLDNAKDIVVDIIGSILPLPTISIRDSSGNDLNEIIVTIEIDQHGSPIWHGRSQCKELYYLHNLTDEDLNFRVKCSRIRFTTRDSGVENIKELSMDKDSLGVVCSLSKGFLPAGEKYDTSVALSVSRVEVDGTLLTDLDSLQEDFIRITSHVKDDTVVVDDDVVAEAFVAIYDESNPVHLPQLCRVRIRLSLSPTHHTGRPFESDDVLNRPSHREIDSPATSELTAAPRLRVRGVSPCPSSNLLYEINVGQQVCQQEEMEWTMSLENLSQTHRLLYMLSPLSQSDTQWLSVMQSGGSMNAGGVSSVVLHFNRSRLGTFSTYLMIENLVNLNDMHIVRCSMEVVQDWTKMTSESEDDKINMLHRYFVVRTPSQALASDVALRLLSWNAPSGSHEKLERLSKTDISQPRSPMVDFGEVFVGHLYTRRSFSIVNTAEIALDFHLTSTFEASELGFSLTPVSPRMSSRITVMPGETRVVHLIYKPCRSVAECAANDESPQRVTGMVFISCKLVKNHHEIITVRAHRFNPKFCTSIAAYLPDDTATKRAMQMNVRNTFSSYFTPPLSASMDSPSDYIWHTNIVMGVRNISNDVSSEPLIITFFSAMVCFVLDIYRDEATNHLLVSSWNHVANEGKGAIADVVLQPGEEVFIKVTPIVDIDAVLLKFEPKRRGTSNGYYIGAEDHFMIYNRRNPSERCRVPVRLLIPSNDEQVGALDRDAIPSSFPHAMEVKVSFAALEGTIASFLKEFASFWGELIDSECPEAIDCGINGWAYDLTSSSAELPWADDSYLSIQNRTPRDIASILGTFFSRLQPILRITESGMYLSDVEQCTSPESSLTPSLIAMGTRFTELFLHFHAITDMLVLHTMRQSSFGHEIMTPARTGLPVARLALLLYTVVFRHPIFMCYDPNSSIPTREISGTMPIPLLPFCKLPAYYTGFFYETSGENNMLLEIRDHVFRLVGK